MRLHTRSRFPLLLLAALMVAVLTAACGPGVPPPPEGARLVSSGPADPQPPRAARAAARDQAASAPDAQPPVTPSPVAQPAAAAASPIAHAASPVPTSSVSSPWATTEATFLVSNTLGRGMALRSAPVSRDPGKLWPEGTRMTGLGAEQEAYGWTWRRVRDPDGNVGWMPSNYLVQDDSVPAPASSGGLQPPSAPPTLILVPTRGVPEATPTAGPTPPAGSPTPAVQNASAPRTDELVSPLQQAISRAGAGGGGLPALFGGR